MELRPFIQTVLLDEVRIMHQNGVRMHTLAAVAHGIEVCGALLDSKPFKAKDLGRSRFNLALRLLFPKAYGEANGKVDLYSQLRSHMSHSLIPGNLLLFDALHSHLELSDGVLHLSQNELVKDYENAIQQLLQLLDSGKLVPKKMGTTLSF